MKYNSIKNLNHQIQYALFMFGLCITISSMMGCSDKGVPTRNLQSESTQIGSLFDRTTLVDQTLHSQTLFRIESELSGTKGMAIYVGKANDSFLFLTNKHVVNESIDSCDDHILIFDKNNEIVLGCSEYIKSFEDTDLTLISMKHIWNSNREFAFTAAEFSMEEDLEDFERLNLVTLDLNTNEFMTDNQSDCYLLSKVPQLAIDPDFGEIESWSVPVGCDAKPGDSGSPIYNSNGKIVAVLWGGKFKKKFINSSELKKKAQQVNQSLWNDFNYAVPSSVILEHLPL